MNADERRFFAGNSGFKLSSQFVDTTLGSLEVSYLQVAFLAMFEWGTIPTEPIYSRARPRPDSRFLLEHYSRRSPARDTDGPTAAEFAAPKTDLPIDRIE